MRAVHCSPLRGDVVLNVPSPVTGRSHGIAPTGEAMAPLPEHDDPSSWPAVRKSRSALNDAGNVLITYVDVLFGRFCFMKSMNCGVTIRPARLIATSDRSTSPDVKKNVRSRRIGPPRPQEYSLRP